MFRSTVWCVACDICVRVLCVVRVCYLCTKSLCHQVTTLYHDVYPMFTIRLDSFNQREVYNAKELSGIHPGFVKMYDWWMER